MIVKEVEKKGAIRTFPRADNLSIGDFADEIVALCPDAIIGVNRRGIISIFNEAAERVTGWHRLEVAEKMSITEIYAHPGTARKVKKMLYDPNINDVGSLIGFETIGKKRDGTIYPVRLSAVLLYKDGKEVGSVGYFHDLTQRKQIENELLRLSRTDDLTGLYNHRHFLSTINDEILRANRYKRSLSLAFFDIDNFKLFNDAFGHIEGDRLLKEVADSARAALRINDYVFRYGGDEFVLIFVETDLESGIIVAERFRKIFNSRWKKFKHFHEEMSPKKVSLSMGIVQRMGNESLEQLLLRADQAMYKAKKAGGDQILRA